MIKQVFDIESYWRVIVYYNIDYTLFNIIADELKRANANEGIIKRIYNNMRYGTGKAVTYSNTRICTSIVLFNIHADKLDYIDSIVHEAEHIKQDILYAYDIEDKGESPAYTIGFIVRNMFSVFKLIII